MGDAPDLTIEILKQIRDEMRLTRTELGALIEQTNERLDRTNERLDRTNERLDQVVHEQIRHATAIVELESGQRALERGQGAMVVALGKLFDGQEQVIGELQRLNARIDNVFVGPLGSTVRQHDERFEKLETRVDALERRRG